MIRPILFGLMAGWIAVVGGIALAADQQQEQAAVQAAEAWLMLVDEGKYDESWSQTAKYFQAAVSREDWTRNLQGVRDPLGKKVSRNAISAKYVTSLPGAPDGEYVVIQFATSFANKQSAVETVTPMLEKDGMWRVSGYYID